LAAILEPGSRPHLGALLLGLLHRQRQAHLCRPRRHREPVKVLANLRRRLGPAGPRRPL
jgi:hypothetical protein